MVYFCEGVPRVLSCLSEAQAQRQAVVSLCHCRDLLAVVTSAAVQIWGGLQVPSARGWAWLEARRITFAIARIFNIMHPL